MGISLIFCYLCSVKKNNTSVMKHISSVSFMLLLFAVAALFTSCDGCSRQPAAVAEADCHLLFDTVRGERYQMLAHDADTNILRSDYTVCWPRAGQLPDSLEQQLLDFLFGVQYRGEGRVRSLSDGCEAFLSDISLMLMDDDDFSSAVPSPTPVVIDSLHPDSYDNSNTLNLEIIDLGNLVTFVRYSEFYVRNSPHGLYGVTYLTLDRTNHRFMQLSDLMDTTTLGSVLLQAVSQFPDNWETVRNCLFEPDQPLPVPHSFFIDSTRANVVFTYQLYEITPYACGIPSVVVPVQWLATQLPLTPYATQLLRLDADALATTQGAEDK